MDRFCFTRRQWLAGTGSALATSALRLPGWAVTTAGNDESDRARRMQWWHKAKFGMFVHWGLYSVLGRHEWVMENEGIPLAEYEPLARRFQPVPNAARAWARLACEAGIAGLTRMEDKCVMRRFLRQQSDVIAESNGR